jgi:hypothetical protein
MQVVFALLFMIIYCVVIFALYEIISYSAWYALYFKPYELYQINSQIYKVVEKGYFNSYISDNIRKYKIPTYEIFISELKNTYF